MVLTNKPTRFNIRVYGLWVDNGRILVNEELIKDSKIIKFPGGGLDLGEGIIDCLKREWKEELNLNIHVLEHFYTTDFYQPSAIDASQVISIYYRVAGVHMPGEIINYVAQERTFWMGLNELTPDTFTLPIDRKVGGMLTDLYRTGKI